MDSEATFPFAPRVQLRTPHGRLYWKKNRLRHACYMADGEDVTEDVDPQLAGDGRRRRRRRAAVQEVEEAAGDEARDGGEGPQR